MENGATMETNPSIFKPSSKVQVVCKWTDRYCYLSGHCGIFCLSTGSVDLCKNHGNPNGRFQLRKFFRSCNF